MKMVMIVAPRDRAEAVVEKVIAQGYGATYTDSRGGRLRQGQKLIFAAVEDDEVESVIDAVRHACHGTLEVDPPTSTAPGSGEMQAHVGCAVVFVWDLDQFDAMQPVS